MAVRYDKKFNAEIRKVVNAYNAKINRLSKAGTMNYLPKKFSANALKNLKVTAKSRKDVRRRLKDLESFTKRGGEKNIQVGKTNIPKYQYESVKKYRRLVTRNINAKLKKYESTKPVSSGKKEKLTFAEQGSDEYLNVLANKEKLLDEPDIESMSEKEIDMYIHKLRVSLRDYDLNVWQNNYIDIFQDTALSYGYDPDKLETITWALQQLDPEQFDELAFEDRNIKAVLTHYKSLLDIQTAEAFEKSSDTVIDNLDAIYDNLSGILAKLNE